MSTIAPAPTRIDLELDPHEIVERVEEMLAWEAIASEQGGLGYHWADFLRADPEIHFGKNASGRLTPKGVCAVDDSTFASLPQEQRFEHQLAVLDDQRREFLPKLEGCLDALGERLSYAVLSEKTSTDEILGVVGKSGDDVNDLTADGASWHGARYVLHSVGEMAGDLKRSLVRQLRLPQVARLFRVQEVFAFEDGRSSSGSVTRGYWNGTLWDIHTRRPLDMRTTLNGGSGPVFLADIFNGWGLQMARRSEWTVELSLGPKRTGVGLPTDAVGARDFLNRLRGNESRAGRKASMVHWVSEHMRRSRGSGDEHLVRAHLRGRQTLQAGQFTARIWPSRVDIDLACNGKRFDRAQGAA